MRITQIAYVIRMTAALCIIPVLLTGCYFQVVRTSPDMETKMYIQKVLSQVLGPWDVRALDRYVTPNFYNGFSHSDTIHFFAVSRRRLGRLRTYVPTSCTERYSVSTDGWLDDIRCVYDARFTKADGTIDIELMKNSNNWKVFGLYINSDGYLQQ